MNRSSVRRHVIVESQARHLSFDREPSTASLAYPGIAVTCLVDGQRVLEQWLPAGAPSELDDERLIAVLHRALRWCEENADLGAASETE